MVQMQVLADYHEAQRTLSGLKTLCEKEQFTEALNQVKYLEVSLKTITSLPEWQKDEKLKAIVIESYDYLNLLSAQLSEKKIRVGEKLKIAISNNKKIKAYKSI